MLTVIWRNLQTTEMQYCSMMKSQTVNEIFGLVVSVYQDKPLWVRYKIECTASWQTKRVKVQQVYERNLRELNLDIDEDKRWYENGVEVLDLRAVKMLILA